MNSNSNTGPTFKLIVESTLIGMILVNRESKIAFANSQAEKLFGFTRRELLGQTIEMLMPARFRARHPAYMNKSFVVPATHQMGAGRDLFALRKDGTEFPVEIRLSPIENPDGTLMLAAITDITDRKKAEEQLLASNQELEAFSYSVSHDLRAPLRAIHGYAQILKEDYGNQLSPDAGQLMNNIMKNAEKMGKLIDDLLAFSRLGRRELQLHNINMHDLVLEMWNELKNEPANSKIEFRINKLLPGQGDNVTIRQVWLNLILNAIKYSRLKDKPTIEIGCEEKGDEIIYYVKDNGAGFDMRYADKLFGVFQRLHTDEEFEGTGVGLAIVQRIVMKHGGKIWAEGKVNQGATFYFSLKKS